MAVTAPGDGPARATYDSPPDHRAATAAVPAAPRLHWIDWLRVAAIAGVFVYHTFRPFDANDWHVKNAETSALLSAPMTWFWTFGLALLFLLAGAGTRFALRKRTWQTFLRERTTRLLVPFVAGTLLLSPIQSFIQATHYGRYSGSFVGYLGSWVGEVGDALGRGPSPTISGVGYHLWFLGFLFAISVIALPICKALMGPRGRRTVEALARRFGRTGASLVFAIPIALLMGVSAPLGSDEHDWFELGWYFGYFVIGFLVLSDDRLLAAIRRDTWVALGVAAISAVTLAVVDLEGWATSLGDRGLDWSYPLMGLLFATEGWAWTVVILGIGMRAARLQVPVIPRVGDAVLPVYVIHQPVILAVAFFVVGWPVGILPKWIVVFGASLAITLAFVELALRAPLTRVLLGARGRPATRLVPVPDRAAVGEPLAARPSERAHHAHPH
jgi:peptidoglycan/LPS O-acetylase OafA/YrhL